MKCSILNNTSFDIKYNVCFDIIELISFCKSEITSKMKFVPIIFTGIIPIWFTLLFTTLVLH